jgi:hypothetical protein
LDLEGTEKLRKHLGLALIGMHATSFTLHANVRLRKDVFSQLAVGNPMADSQVVEQLAGFAINGTF